LAQVNDDAVSSTHSKRSCCCSCCDGRLTLCRSIGWLKYSVIGPSRATSVSSGGLLSTSEAAVLGVAVGSFGSEVAVGAMWCRPPPVNGRAQARLTAIKISGNQRQRGLVTEGCVLS